MKITDIAMLGLICIVVGFTAVFGIDYLINSDNIAGGNEILDTSCTDDNNLTILVGKFNGERVWVTTEIKCEGEN